MGHNSGNLKVQLLENNSAYFFFDIDSCGEVQAKLLLN